MILIGITGKAGAGKDSIGDVLYQDHHFARTSFAAPIKEAICVMLDEPMSKWNDRVWKETVIPSLGVTPRYMAQTLGTEWGRYLINKDIWLNLAMAKAKTINLVITDVRFENEAAAVRKAGTLVHVHRSVIGETIDNMSHASELGITPHPDDIHISNNGTLQQLEHEAGVVYQIILDRNRTLLNEAI